MDEQSGTICYCQGQRLKSQCKFTQHVGMVVRFKLPNNYGKCKRKIYLIKSAYLYLETQYKSDVFQHCYGLSAFLL